ncbi:DNA polymerase III subunit delta [Ferrimonas marina]|uniref:DNA polymerase III subunit delta n=1 Tax=Ferrimonas marina TaxID=299255 RepID=A0A1M5W000_9GAMM|nr:DNA polymerase III subunit delta [Ferrimonas marina]SHH80738.1 DNA polymerase III, delta subunit [Ferrimonas marina]
MRIFANQLPAQLKQLPQILMVFGDDVLIREECRDSLRQALFSSSYGIEERLSLVQESPFDWNALLSECHSLSLFASRRLIELELPNLKPGTDGATALQELAALLPTQQDTFLLLHGPKAGREQTNTKWFKALDGAGLYVQALTPEGRHYQRWLSDRARHHQVQLTPDALAQLAPLFEGNLLAADQALAQLGLISAGARIEADTLGRLLEDQSRYSAFQLVDALLAGQMSRAFKILGQLQLEGTAPNLVSWSLIRELTLLCRLAQARQVGTALPAAMKQAKIWDKRQPLYGSTMERLSNSQLADAMAAAGVLERGLKGDGMNEESQWLALADLCARFSGDYQPLEVL